MIKQILVSSCVLFSATFVVQAQNPKLGGQVLALFADNLTPTTKTIHAEAA